MIKTSNQPKAPYSSPKLAVYGAFSQLTASGTQGNKEGTGVGNRGSDRLA